MQALVGFIDRLNIFIGKAASWLVFPLTFALGYEVVVRYIFGAPTTWAYDATYMIYGTLFMLAAPFTLAVNGHVRGDMIYRTLRPRVQATLDFVLYFVFFMPAMLALLYAGWDYAYYSYSIGERSSASPGGPIVWPLKMVIPATAFLMALQGIAQLMRCARAIKRGDWE